LIELRKKDTYQAKIKLMTIELQRQLQQLELQRGRAKDFLFLNRSKPSTYTDWEQHALPAVN
jgi:hypothetical protein